MTFFRDSVREPLPQGLSLYLDVVRGLAAVAVLLDHANSPPIAEPGLWWRLLGYGSAAVTIFFVLSGYVIAYVIETRDRTAGDYVVSRLSRLYSVVLVALALTFGLDLIGEMLNPTFYGQDRVVQAGWSGWAASAFMLNEFRNLGITGLVPGSNGPFWSLSFEFAYYIAAALAVFAPARLAWPAIALLLAMAGPTITALAPCWFLGFAMYRWRTRIRLRYTLAPMVFVMTTALLIWIPKYADPDGLGRSDLFPFGRGSYPRNILVDYAIAATFALQLLAVAARHSRIPVSSRALAIGRWLGSMTFPLYCLHFPLLCFLSALSPFARTGQVHWVAVAAGTIAIVMLAEKVTTRLQTRLKHLLRVIWSRFR